jgi:uncharacterized protein YjlB
MMMTTNPKPDVTTYLFDDDGSIPNNPTLPLIVYTQALDPIGDLEKAFRDTLAKNRWGGTWVSGVYGYHHYHSTAHEVLCVLRGGAEVMFGGKDGVAILVQPGDVVIIPAGVGHCNLSSGDDFKVLGAYPEGQTWDLCTGKPGERPQVLENIRNVPLPKADPIFGTDGPLMLQWKSKG